MFKNLLLPFKPCLTLLCFLICLQPTAFSQKVTIVESGIKLDDYQKLNINKAVQNMYDYYNSIFECGEIPLKMILFGDQEQFRNYEIGKISTIASDYGYYSRETNTMVISPQGNYIAVAYHEACHAILLNAFPAAPPWVYEGMAEYFEHGTVRGNKFITGKDKEGFVKIKNWEKKGMIHLSDFLQWTPQQWNYFDKGNFFSRYVSYGIVYFLMEKYPTVMKDVLSRLYKRQTSLQAMNGSYPGGIEALQKDFSEYFK